MRMEDLERKKLKELIIKSDILNFLVNMLRKGVDEETKKIIIGLSNKIHKMSIYNDPLDKI